jgi:hypothetical protein
MTRKTVSFPAALVAILGTAIVVAVMFVSAAMGASKSSSLFTQDKGIFRILANGQQVGKEEFEINPSGGEWVAKGTSEIQAADGVTRVSGTLQLHADGTPANYEWSTEGAKKASATIGFSGPTATIELRMEGRRPFTQQFTFNSPQIAVLDNNLYYQYAILAHL